MTRPLVLVANPFAAGGKGLRVLEAAGAALQAAGVEHRAVETRSLEHAREEARAAAAEGETVVAIGGDGMVGALAGELRGAEVPLGIVPGGRGNDFARVLGVPFETNAAVGVLVEGHERLVDVAQVDGRPFVGIASLGFDSDANRIANETKLIRGNLVYVVAALRALAGWRHASYTITIDGETHEARGYSVAVGNSKAYGGGMFLIPHAEVDDGRLDVFISGEDSKLGFLRGLPKVFKGAHVTNPHVRFLQGRVVSVDADRPFTVYADGDPIGDLPVTVSVRERCLRVIVPRS